MNSFVPARNVLYAHATQQKSLKIGYCPNPPQLNPLGMILLSGNQKDSLVFSIYINLIAPYDWIWHVEDLANDKGVYVDLKLNPEAYTGY